MKRIGSGSSSCIDTRDEIEFWYVIDICEVSMIV